jgi:hypothetical protein
VLINGWCQQFPSHSLGTLAFGPGGYLYVSGGDGAGFGGADYGQLGGKNARDRPNPCGDPPAPAGTALRPPTAEGGALRSRSARRADGPATLAGTVLRLKAATGAPAPGNPFAAGADRDKRRVLGYGLRNPFRFTFRPGTRQLWLGGVGYNTWEQIDRIPDVPAWQPRPQSSAAECGNCRRPVPSAFTSRMSPSASYAIRRPSGLQSGSWSFSAGSSVSCRCADPSGCIVHTCPCVSFESARMKAMSLPLGDQAGYSSYQYSVLVICRGCGWVTPVTQMSPGTAPLTPQVKAIWRPSGV